MAAYNYIAFDAAGKRRKGVIEADSERLVRQQLREKGLVPLSVILVTERVGKKVEEKKWVRQSRRLFTRKIRIADLALITRQLAVLLSAGIPLDEVLSGVAEQAEKNHVKSILLGVRAKVVEGHSLASGMAQFPSTFSQLYRTTVAAGERSGKLDVVLIKLAEYIEKQHTIRQKIRQALLYPMIMTTMSLLVVIFLLIYVVPKIVVVFTQTNQVLPVATIILIGLSNFLQHYGLYLLLALIIVFYGFRQLLKRTGFRYQYDRLLLRIPLLGKVTKTINSARFGRTFGILTAAGVPVLEGMEAATKLITPLPMRKAVETAREKIREGASIHYALQGTGYFSPMFIHLVASGEASGRLEEMLEKAAFQQENDVEVIMQTLLTLFEPLMILIMGSIVLFIVLAIMLPIFQLDQLSGANLTQ